jgi:hypothetical protein
MSRAFQIWSFAFKSLAICTLLAAFIIPAAAQQASSLKKPLPIEGDKSDEHDPFAGIEDEMRAKRAIKFAEKEYQENIERARDLSTLGASIVASYKQKLALADDDFKKLGKVEKLAKSIRNAAGGSEDEVKIEKPPTDMTSAVEMLGDMSRSLKEKVEQTPKHVVSADVIDQANVLLELIRILRTLPAKT